MSETSWDHRATIRAVGARFGSRQRELAEPSILGLAYRWQWAIYHFDELRSLYSGLRESSIEPSGTKPEGVLWDHSVLAQINRAQISIGANAIASAQSIHALADLSAHAVHYGLAYDRLPDAPTGSAINHKEALQRFKEVPVVVALSDLVEGNDFEHLAALVNECKHRAVIPAAIVFDATGSAVSPYWLQFNPFRRVTKSEDRSFPAREIEPFLTSEINRVSSAMVRLGGALDQALQQR